jgi:ADP-ribose pyrophosphatase
VEEKFLQVLKEMKGKFLHFRQDEVMLSSGKKTVRDTVLHPGAVAIAALTGEGEIIFVRQYRYPIGQVCYEIPAGKLETGEDPLETAQRELEEETGYKAAKWEKLASFFTAPGFSNEVIHLYRAEGLEATGPHPDPDEIIEFEKIPLSRACAMLNTGEIKDAKSIIGLLWLMKERQSLENLK